MPSKYLPKMKVSTAKSTAKNLLSTPTGKKISDTAFKKFIKQDKDLKKFSYSQDQSTISKFQAKKIFGQVIKSAQDSDKFKISRFAQKLGIKKSGDEVQASDIALNKTYQKGASEELSTQKPAGPTAQELRREKRHEQAVKTFHKRERADEITKDRLREQKPAAENQPASQRTTAPMAHATNTKTQPLADQVSAGSTTMASADRSLLPVLVLPLQNISSSAENLDWISRKIEQLIIQTLGGLRMFKIVSREARHQAWATTPVDINDEASLRLAAKRAWASLCVVGTIKKTGRLLEIAVDMFNINNNQRLPLVTVKEESDDTFNLERKISWQINSAIKEKSKPGASPEKSSPKQAKDLPI